MNYKCINFQWFWTIIWKVIDILRTLWYTTNRQENSLSNSIYLYIFLHIVTENNNNKKIHEKTCIKTKDVYVLTYFFMLTSGIVWSKSGTNLGFVQLLHCYLATDEWRVVPQLFLCVDVSTKFFAVIFTAKRSSHPHSACSQRV